MTTRLAQDVGATWTHAGFFKGKIAKTRTRPVVTPAVAAYALSLGYLCGLRGQVLLESFWATPALARLICLEGADASSYQKVENHLLETGGIRVGARQIQRLIQRVGKAAQAWQERQAQPGGSAVPIMYALTHLRFSAPFETD